MKKQINPTIKAHLIRGAFYLLSACGCLRDPICAGGAKHGRREGVANDAALSYSLSCTGECLSSSGAEAAKR